MYVLYRSKVPGCSTFSKLEIERYILIYVERVAGEVGWVIITAGYSSYSIEAKNIIT